MRRKAAREGVGDRVGWVLNLSKAERGFDRLRLYLIRCKLLTMPAHSVNGFGNFL